MTDRLKAWCHWKRKENHVSEDDMLMVRDIEALIEVAEAAKTYQHVHHRDDVEICATCVALEKLEAVE